MANFAPLVGEALPKFTDAQKALIKGSADFYGLNHYGTGWAAFAGDESLIMAQRTGDTVSSIVDSTLTFSAPLAAAVAANGGGIGGRRVSASGGRKRRGRWLRAGRGPWVARTQVGRGCGRALRIALAAGGGRGRRKGSGMGEGVDRGLARALTPGSPEYEEMKAERADFIRLTQSKAQEEVAEVEDPLDAPQILGLLMTV